MAVLQKYNFPTVSSGASSSLSSTMPSLKPTVFGDQMSAATTGNQQTLAKAGQAYVNPSTGLGTSFTQAELDSNPALGRFSSSYQAVPSATNTYGQNVGANGTTTPGTVSSDNYTATKDQELIDLAKQEAQARRDALTAERDRQIAFETAQWDQKINEAKMKNEEQSASEKAIQFRLGTAGTNIASQETARAEVYRQNVLSQLERSKVDVIARIKNAASDDDWKAVSELRQTLAGINKNAADLRQQEFTNKLAMNADIRAEENQKRQNTLANFQILGEQNKIRETIPVGETRTFDMPDGTQMTLTGAEVTKGFWDATDIKDLMKNTPLGQTMTVWDPNLKKNIQVQGIANPQKDLKQFTATDDAGNMRIINFDPTKGKVVGIANAGNVGKTKSETRVNVSTSNYGTSVVPVYNGKDQIGTARPGSKGDMLFFDKSGKEITQYSLPAGYTLGTLAAGNPETKKPSLVNSILGEPEGE